MLLLEGKQHDYKVFSFCMIPLFYIRNQVSFVN